MRRALMLILPAAVWGTQLRAQEPAEAEPPSPWRTSYYPYLTGGTNDGPVIAFRVRHWQPAAYEDRVTTTGSLNADVGVTLKGGRHAVLWFRAPQLVNRWRFIVGGGAVREVRFGYFGIGNDTEKNDALVTPEQPFLYRVRRTRYEGRVEATRRLRGPLQLGLMASVEHAKFTALPEPSLFRSDFSSELHESDVSARLALVYDTRDNEYNTHSGLLLETGAQVASGGNGYTRLYTILRGYAMPREGTVIAARFTASGIGGTPTLDARYTLPGWEKDVQVLGGQYSHRSFDTGRFAGEHVLFGNLEVRHDVLAFGDLGAITLIGFLDAGRVFEGEPFKLTTDGVKVGGGGGIGLRILRSSILTFNFAGGPDGFNWSVGTGWMF